MTTIFLVRHGEVHNPAGIIYGRLPGYRLSEGGRAELAAAAEALSDRGPYDALFTSPLERARESAQILGARLRLEPIVDERLAETDVAGYQGKSFDALPRPYLTEDGVPGIESAAAMRARLIDWVASLRRRERIVAVSHRDPIAVLLLHWMAADLSRGPDLTIPTGAIHEARLEGARVDLSGPAVG